MIVKNEEATLKRVLHCAKKFANEIIIVDTGSTDNTKQIAKEFTDKIFDFVWQDDFALARNYAFSKATCDYQMWLDADDIVEDEDIAKILQLKNSDTDTDVFMFKYSVANLEYYRERLLKRSKNFKWQGFVHEAISPSGKIEYCDIKITHKKEKQSDAKRNLNLYRKALKRGVIFKSRELYYYSRELFYNGYVNKAIANLKKFIKLKDSYPPDNLGAHLMLAECYNLKNQPQKALDILIDALKIHLPTAELCCKIAFIFESLNKKENAIFYFKTALTCPRTSEGFVEKDYCDIIPLLELTKLCYTQNFQEAIFYHQQAKLIAPNHPSVLFNNKFFE